MQDLVKTVAKTTFTQEGVLRKKYVAPIERWLSRPEIVIIKGIRRCGKSTILQQVAARLSKKAVYINFDDYRLLNHLTVDLLEAIVETFPHINYFFFDEIQKVEGFESWLRTYYDIKAHKKFIISGSNISLFSPSLGTVLTGRNITFEIFPFDFGEFTAFGKGNFEDFMTYGGFPEVVLEKDVERKKQLLLQYFDDILLRDVFERYSIVSTQQFKALAQYIIANSGLKISAHKLGKELDLNSRSAEKYLSYLVDAYLIFEVPYFSHSLKTKYIAGRASKYYSLDNGLTTVLAARINRGHLCESVVAQKLRKEDRQVYYWSDGDSEVDFVLKKQAINVTATDEIPKREFTGLENFQKKHKGFDTLLVTKSTTKEQMIAIERFLLQSEK